MMLAALEVDPKRRPSIALFAAALLLVRLGSAIVQTMERLPKIGYLGFGARPHWSLDSTTPDQAYFTPLPLRLAI